MSNIFFGLKKGSDFYFFSIIRDIGKRVEIQKKLYQQAITDPLTGMYNRRYFDEILKSEFDRAKRYRRSFSVIAGQHHEQIEGMGYPRGLKGDAILIESKILTASDCYVAMSSDRPYRKALKKNKVVKILKHEMEVKFDSEVVKLLFEIEGLS